MSIHYLWAGESVNQPRWGTLGEPYGSLEGSFPDCCFKRRPLSRRQTQAVLRASIQEIRGPRRPFRFAEEGSLALIKVAAEVASKICAGAGRTEKFPRARAVQPRAMTEQA